MKQASKLSVQMAQSWAVSKTDSFGEEGNWKMIYGDSMWLKKSVCVFACPWWVLSHIASVIEGTVDQQSDRLCTTIASGLSDTHLYSQADMADWLRFI